MGMRVDKCGGEGLSLQVDHALRFSFDLRADFFYPVSGNENIPLEGSAARAVVYLCIFNEGSHVPYLR